MNKRILGVFLVFSIIFTNFSYVSAIAEERNAESSTIPAATTVEPLTTPDTTTSPIPEEDTDSPPSVPENVVQIESTETTISIAWDASTDDFGVIGYDIYRDGVLITRSASTNFIDTGLTPETSYTYTVIAIDASNQQSETSNALTISTNRDITAPSTPQTLQCTLKTTTSITLTWTASTDNIGVAGYTVYSGNTALESIDQTILSLENLISGTTYELVVKAYDAYGNESQASDVVLVTTLPSIPVDIVATSTSRMITLNWAPVTGAVGYDIQNKSGTIKSITSTTYADNYQPANAQYSYKIRAKTATDNGEWSDAVYIWTKLSTPVGLSVVEEKNNMSLTWFGVSGATSYEVEIDGNVVANVATTNYTHENLVANEVHVYRIRAKNNNTESIWTDPISKTAIDYIPISGIISSDRTLTPQEGPYGVVGTLTIAAGVTLTIEAGTLIRVNPITNINVYGAIQANGDELHNINFTSMKDKQYGGSGIAGYSDYWGKIIIKNGGIFYGSNVNLHYFGKDPAILNILHYGFYLDGANTTLMLNHCNLKGTQNEAIRVYSSVTNLNLQITNCTFESIGGYGVFFDGQGSATGSVSITENNFIGCGICLRNMGTANFIVDNNTFSGNSNPSIDIRGFGFGAISVKHNTISDGTNYPIQVYLGGLETSAFEFIDDNTFINNTSKGNQVNGIAISGRVAPGKTITLPGKRKYIASSSYGVEATGTLNIEAGAWILGDNAAASLSVYGKTNILGTYDAPVVLTTINDKEYGGSGVKDGYDKWGGISVYGEIKAEYAVIRLPCTDGVYCSNGQIDFQHCEFSYARYAILLQSKYTPILKYNSFVFNNYAIATSSGSDCVDLTYNYFGTLYKPNIKNVCYVYTTKVNYIPWIGYESAYKFRKGITGANSATGNYSTANTDLSYSIPGFKLSIDRNYNSTDAQNPGLVGKGWIANCESRVKDYTAQIKKPDGTFEPFILTNVKTVTLLDGRMITFTQKSDGTYEANDSRNTLKKLDDGSYQMTTPDQFVYHFGTNGFLLSVEDRNGNVLTFVYSSDNKLTAIVDPTGRQLVFIYNEQGYIGTITDPMGRTVTYGYNADGYLEYVVNPMGAITTYEYDESGLLCKIKNNDGAAVETVVYQAADGEDRGKASQITDQHGNVKTYTYDNVNSKTTITDSNGKSTVQEYDDSYTVKKSIDPDGRSVVVEYFLNSQGQNNFWQVKSTTDKSGNKTSYEIDASGNVTKITNPDSGFRQMTYDSNNNLTSLRDEEGKYTYYIYDSDQKNLIKQIKPLNGTDVYDGSTDEGFTVTTYTYYSDAERQSLGYRAKGLMKSATDPEGGVTTYTYDSNGYPQNVTNAMGKTTRYTYNSLGWLTQEISPLGKTINYSYDKNGNQIKKIMNGGETFRAIYDSEGKLLKEVQPSQYQVLQDDATTFAYSGDHGTRYTYYDSGKVRTITDAEDNVTSCTYDLYGNVATQTNPDGAIYRYEYDILNRLTNTFYRENAADDEVMLEENIYSVLSGGITQKIVHKYVGVSAYLEETYKFDYANRQLEKRNADGTTIKTEYYKNGLEKSSTDANSKITSSKYNGLNLLTEQWEPFEANGSSTVYAYMSYAYDKAGRKTQERKGKALVALNIQPAEYIAATYKYGADGNLSAKTDSSGARTEYEYDDDGLLIRQKDFTAADSFIEAEYINNYWNRPDVKKVYVCRGDISGESFSNTDLLALLTSYTYDVNGNIATQTDPNGVITTYGYDHLNRQTSVSKPGVDEYGNPTVIATSRVYDYTGNVISQTDANDNEATYVYDGRGFLIRTIDALGNVSLNRYDLLGRLTAAVSPLNYRADQLLSSMNRTEFSYDPMGRVKTESRVYYNSASSQWVSYVHKAYKYDSNGNMIKELDSVGYDAGSGSTADQKISNGYGVESTYNYANLVVTRLDPVAKSRSLSFTTKYTYDPSGRVISETGANKAINLYTYDDAGNLLSTQVKKNEASPAVVVQSSTYDKQGNMLTQTDGNGNVITYTYNELRKVRSVTYPHDDTISEYMIRSQYDKVGNLVYIFANDDTEKYSTYDNQGRKLSERRQYSDGTNAITVLNAYDRNGNVRFTIDGNGHVTENTYDALDRLSETMIQVSGIEQTTAYAYDDNGNLLTTTDWLGNVKTNEYDSLNRLIKVRDAYDVAIEKFEYNGNDTQINSTDAVGNLTQYTYDRNNCLLTTKDGAGHVSGKTYDNAGNVSSEYDGKNNTTKYEYDEYKRLIKVTNPKNEVTIYTYDLNGNLLTLTDGKGNTKIFEYNMANKIKRSIDVGGRAGSPGDYTYDQGYTTSYTYNKNGALHSMTDRNGVTTTYTHDNHGRLLIKQAGTFSISFTYDGNGNQLTMTDATGTTTRTYDELNRVLTKAVPAVGTATYAYDITDGQAGGYVAERSTDPMGNIVLKTYDKVGRLYSVTDRADVTVYTYYANGAKQSVAYSSGAREEYAYLEGRLLRELINRRPDGSVMDSYTYTYDAAHNQTSKIEIINGVQKGTTSYTYDTLNRLLTVKEPSARTTTYAYDAAGNRLSETTVIGSKTVIKTYDYDKRNRLTRIVQGSGGVTQSDWAYGYDGNGNLLSATETTYISGVPQTPTITINSYDAWNQLIKTLARNYVVESAYNGDGLRVSKTINGTKTWYFYEYTNVVLETNDNGDETARNIYGTSLVKRVIGAEEYDYFYNGHADVTALVNPSTGTVAASYYYDAFGVVLESTGTVSNSILYAGYQYDRETGYYYLNARMYDPAIARFLQEDTYRGRQNDPLSLNLYTYCHNEPLMYSDPTGHSRLWKAVSDMASSAGEWVSGAAKAAGSAWKDSGKIVRESIKKTEKITNKTLSNVKNFVTENKTAIITGVAAATSITAGALVTPINPILGGALFGSGISIATTMAFDYADDGRINRDVRDYVYAGASGFVTGMLLPGMGSGASAMHKAAWTGMSAMTGDMVGQTLSKGSINLGQTARVGVTAVAVSAAFSVGSKLVSKVWDKVQTNVRNLLADETGGMSIGSMASEGANKTGAYNPGLNANIGNGLGKLAGKSINVSGKGLDLVKNHISQFGDVPENTAMIYRIESALKSGQAITGADASFYMHEAAEATMMQGGSSYKAAHEAALQKYSVSPFSVYHPEVIQNFSEWFNQGFKDFWGLK